MSIFSRILYTITVFIMEYRVRVDKKGRLVIPVSIRKSLGLDKGGEVILKVIGNKIVIEVIDSFLAEKVAKWKKTVLSIKAKPMSEEVSESWKWVDVEYAKRKLGL